MSGDAGMTSQMPAATRTPVSSDSMLALRRSAQRLGAAGRGEDAEDRDSDGQRRIDNGEDGRREQGKASRAEHGAEQQYQDDGHGAGRPAQSEAHVPGESMRRR
jgi:hypothetical protein